MQKLHRGRGDRRAERGERSQRQRTPEITTARELKALPKYRRALPVATMDGELKLNKVESRSPPRLKAVPWGKGYSAAQGARQPAPREGPSAGKGRVGAEEEGGEEPTSTYPLTACPRAHT